MEALLASLKKYFGFSEFRPGQAGIIQSIIDGEDALLVMPTGSGKSLCFQLPALMLEGTAIIVSPLIALMKDQVDTLTARHLPATFLNSSLSSSEAKSRLRQMSAGFYKLVYVAPERFRNPAFIEILKTTKISMLAIDEAHCISQWGHDFRPDYLFLETVIAQLPPTTRLMAVTATATEAVRKDILRHLCMESRGSHMPKVVVTGFERANLSLNVTNVKTHAQKIERVLQIVEFFKTGIIYCATRKMVDRVQEMLENAGIHALAYSGTMKDEDRTRVQDAFMNRDMAVVVATNAFGMGVDRSDIRFVIHWDIPGSVEAYYQEVGRAGRDGAFAWCELLFNYADVHTQRFFIENMNPQIGQIREFYTMICNQCAQHENGIAEFSVDGWANLAGIKSATIARSLLALFERQGLILRSPASTPGEVGVKCIKNADLSVIQTICDSAQKKTRSDLERLQEMISFVQAKGCRHRFLLSYFGEPSTFKNCKMCDVCCDMHHFPRREAPSKARLIRLKKVLSCVGRMHGNGTQSAVIAVLQGQDERYSSLSTYGLMRDASTESIAKEYAALELDGFIKQGCLSSKGYDFVTGKLLDVEIPQSGVFKQRQRTQSPIYIEPSEEMSQVSQGLATTLRAWVRQEALKRGIPAYMILQNKVITLIEKRRPTTFDELALIPGMGERKLAKYGEAILTIINS